MKKSIIMLICLVVMVNTVMAGNLLKDNKKTIIGVLVGTGSGLAIGNNTDIKPEIAAPVLAVALGLVGNNMDKKDKRKKSRSQTEQVIVKEKPKPINYHPGIDIIKIPITHSNGISTDIRIVRVGNKYVGPQGEEYATLPRSDELYKKYGQ